MKYQQRVLRPCTGGFGEWEMTPAADSGELYDSPQDIIDATAMFGVALHKVGTPEAAAVGAEDISGDVRDIGAGEVYACRDADDARASYVAIMPVPVYQVDEAMCGRDFSGAVADVAAYLNNEGYPAEAITSTINGARNEHLTNIPDHVFWAAVEWAEDKAGVRRQGP